MQETFNRLYREMAGPLEYRIRSVIRDEIRAQEIFQETFLKAWEKRESFRGDRKNPVELKGWINRIASNLCLDELRRRGKQPVSESRFASNEEDEEVWESFLERQAENPFPRPEETLMEGEMLQALKEALGDLDEKKKELIDLVYLKEVSLKEAAVRLGIPYGTAKSRLHYSVKQLSTLFERIYPRETK